MSFPSLALALLLSIGLPVWAGESVPPPPASEADAELLRLDAGLAALAEEMVGLGLPDARGAVLYSGQLNLPSTAAEHRALTARGIHSHGTTYSGDDEWMDWWGLHLRLRDGTWLAGLVQPLTPAEGDLDTSLLHEVPAGTMPEIEDDEKHPESTDDEAGFLAGYAGQDLALLQAAGSARTLWRLYGLREGGGMTARTILLLTRWGFPRPGRLAVLYASRERLEKTRDIGSLTLFQAEQYAIWAEVDLEHRIAAAVAVEKAPRVLSAALPLLRGGLGRTALDRLLAGDTAAAAMARACLPERAAGIDLLVARAGLPNEAAAADPLAKRLVLWSCGDGGWGSDQPLLAGVKDEGDPGDGEDGGRTHRARAMSRRIAPTWDDLPALIALAGDRSPSRWVTRDPVDGSPQPRTVGDNALRAVATLLGCDPRRLIGRDPTAAWDDAARDATAAGLRGWWTAHASSPRPAILADIARVLPPSLIPAFITGMGGADREAVLAVLVERLRGPAPPVVSRRVLAGLLAATLADPVVEPVVAAWPVEGELRLLLAVWHRLKGRSAHLEKELAESLAGDLATEPGRARAVAALNACRDLPTPGIEGAIAAILAGPVDRPVFRLVACTGIDSFSIRMGCFFGDSDPVAMLRQKREDRPEERRALDLAIWLRCLDDHRPLAGAPITSSNAIAWGQERITGTERAYPRSDREGQPPERQVRADWRVCDLAAYVALGIHYHLDREGPLAEQPAFDLFAALADRDAAIAGIRGRSVAKALALFAKLGWANPVPLEATDAKALF